MTTIRIQIRNVYGEEKAYPVCDKAKAFAEIACTKTLTSHTLRKVLDLGFAIEVIDRYGNISRVFRNDDNVGRFPTLCGSRAAAVGNHAQQQRRYSHVGYGTY